MKIKEKLSVNKNRPRGGIHSGSSSAGLFYSSVNGGVANYDSSRMVVVR